MEEHTILDLYRHELERPRRDHYAHVTLTGLKKQSTQEFFSATAAAELGHFRQIKRFRVLPKPLTIEDNYLTPTMKVRRRNVEKDFAHLIEEMYGG